jgi:hypothetical protein
MWKRIKMQLKTSILYKTFSHTKERNSNSNIDWENERRWKSFCLVLKFNRVKNSVKESVQSTYIDERVCMRLYLSIIKYVKWNIKSEKKKNCEGLTRNKRVFCQELLNEIMHSRSWTQKTLFYMNFMHNY